MRWKIKKPKVGDERLLHKFLFFPREINDEIRWLEWVIIEQRYYFGYDFGNHWEDLRWVDSPIYKRNKQ